MTSTARSVTVVIVTYGDRLALLRRVVQALDAEHEVGTIVIVDNGSVVPVTVAALSSAHRITVLRNAHNLGSAGGFAQGIAEALKPDASRYLLILDDDNLGDAGFVGRLIDLHRSLDANDDVAIAALRADRPQYKRLLHGEHVREHVPGSFLGFHVGEIPARLWRRLRPRPERVRGPTLHLREVTQAPYGGLFMSLSAARRVQPPRQDFILYGDDHEYTRRLVDAGVRLYLTDRVCISDIDQSWNLAEKVGSPWLDSGSAKWRIYYAARNHHFMELSAAGAPRAMNRLNKAVFLTRLFGEAAWRQRSVTAGFRSLAPLRSALTDAGRGRLGYNSDFAIPGWSADIAPDADRS